MVLQPVAYIPWVNIPRYIFKYMIQGSRSRGKQHDGTYILVFVTTTSNFLYITLKPVLSSSLIMYTLFFNYVQMKLLLALYFLTAPPPSYEAAIDGVKEIRDEHDNEYTFGHLVYTPLYMIFKPPGSNDNSKRASFRNKTTAV